MSDLIDRQAAIEALDEMMRMDNAPSVIDYNHGIADSIARIKYLPSVQPEIIRCKNCRWYAGEGMYCTNNILVQFDHFFCYYGERKEDKK